MGRWRARVQPTPSPKSTDSNKGSDTIWQPWSDTLNTSRVKYFSKNGKPVEDLTVRDMEGGVLATIEQSEGRSVEVIYGADIATMDVGADCGKKR